MARYTNADDLMLEIDAGIRIAKSKYRELDPNDVIYNPKLTKSKDYYDGIIDAFHTVQARILANMPTADVRENVQAHPVMRNRPVSAEWVTGKDADGIEHTIMIHGIREQNLIPYCSKCGKRLDDIAQNFCPFCGANMRGEKDG